MNFQQSLDYLNGLNPRRIRLGLENIRRVLNHFGDPQTAVPCIHIAGTNGKGSTAAFLESILRSAGHRAGLYTSPHLMDFRERIQVDRRLLPKEVFAELTSRIKQTTERLNLHLTYFEIATVMAFVYFHEAGAGWSVVEVGMGGRLDATNLCRPAVSVITPISLDHTEYLGSGLDAIAGEKAAIIKDRTPCVVAAQEDPARKTIYRRARKQGASVLQMGKDFKAVLKTYGVTGEVFDYASATCHLENLEIPLLGFHQVDNAALAVTAAMQSGALGVNGYDRPIRQGLKRTRWPGRMEVVQSHPTVLLDCAHNPAGVRKLTEVIKAFFHYDRCFFVVGVMKDKDFIEMIEIISLISDRIVLTRPRGERGMEPAILLRKLQKTDKVIEIIEEIPYALHNTKTLSSPDDLICVTGSVHTVAEVRQLFDNEGIIPNNPDPLVGIPDP